MDDTVWRMVHGVDPCEEWPCTGGVCTYACAQKKKERKRGRKMRSKGKAEEEDEKGERRKEKDPRARL